MTNENKTLITPEGHKLTFHERESVDISLNIAKDTLELLEVVAQKRDLSVLSLLKLFIGKGLRDLEPALATEHAIRRFKSRKGSKVDTEVNLAA